MEEDFDLARAGDVDLPEEEEEEKDIDEEEDTEEEGF